MIKTTDFVSEQAKVAAEQEALGALLDAFATEIGAKIFEKMQAGKKDGMTRKTSQNFNNVS